MGTHATAGDHYHHGNLRAALLESALAVLTQKGAAGFSMREAARRAGVSQSAPKHHFGDARGLLGALATGAYRELCERLDALELSGFDVRERVRRIAAEYVSFADENRALFDLMWRMTQFDVTAPELAEQKHRALRSLDHALRGTSAEPINDTDPALVPSYAVWSLVHGYTTLALEGAIDSTNPDPLNSGLLPNMLALLDLSDPGPTNSSQTTQPRA